MFLKSLTLKGFKSFASATHLRLEPGITAIVGPNGSGKSNVVDALAWVMGEQGAKSLRGGKMEDVIFAGTAARAPLGRAEVSLTIDNSDGALPIDYSEVTITRTMFRSGGSDYSLNGTSCRLLDIQELLSDTGIGREMHVIVGQGQLDAVLRATPEERRGFIEEAAGVLKHRRRKERALRKLETMEANLTRVQDLAAEIRRQLGPLARQAETARQAAVIQADARDARLRLLADDLVQLYSALEQEVADESALLARRTELDAALEATRTQLAGLESAAEEARPRVAAAQDTWFRLVQVVDRLTSARSLAAERLRLLQQDADDEPGAEGSRDPDRLRLDAERIDEQSRIVAREIEDAQVLLAQASSARIEAETAYAAERDRLAREERAVADRREGLAKLDGMVAAKRSRIEAGEAEIGRLLESVGSAKDRAAHAEQEFARLEASIASDEHGEEGLDTAYEEASDQLDVAETALEELLARERRVDQARSTAHARAEALSLALTAKDAAGSIIERARPDHGVLGRISGLLGVAAGHETAIAAALGFGADAVVASSLAGAASAVRTLHEEDGGRAAFVVSETARISDRATWPELPGGCRWALDVVRAPEPIAPAVSQMLDRVVLAESAEVAEHVARSAGSLTVVSPAGDVFAPGIVRGGSSAEPSRLELQTALELARRHESEATADGERIRFDLARARTRRDELALAVEAALDRLNDSDARMAAVAEKLGALGSVVRNARAEVERAERAIEAAESSLSGNRDELAELVARSEAAHADGPIQSAPSTDERDRLEAAASHARTQEADVRLTLRVAEERERALSERAAALRRSARAEEQARERREARRVRRLREARVSSAVLTAAEFGLVVLGQARDEADEVRGAQEAERARREVALAEARRSVTALQDEVRDLTDVVHRDEVARAQQKLRIEQLETRAIEELGIEPAELVAGFGPDQLIPASGPQSEPSEPREPREAPQPSESSAADPRGNGVSDSRGTAYVREVQEKRLRVAERRLAALGRINPLALEEYAALEERHRFLSTQVEDLKKSRRDLLDIVREVDERVERAFAEAYHDTAREFQLVFERLFPGGEGRLSLTDPDHLLTTGIDVEARPPGKKIKRLSLLSGGERSLVAVALLVAIFKARPSPFYVMDEVEAALDDANLARLLTLFDELRAASQLIVITHQKKTMEIADALYGVTMRGDGVTTVVSQRIRELGD